MMPTSTPEPAAGRAGTDSADSRAVSPEGDLLIGGQALIEGVMMRSPGAYGIAVRRPDGTLALQSGKVTSLARRYPLFKLPLLRGIGVLFQSLAVGIRALNFSAEQAMAGAAADGGGPKSPKGNSQEGRGQETEGQEVTGLETRTGRQPPEIAARGSSTSGGSAASNWAMAGSMAVGLGLGAVVFLLLPLWLTQLGERHLFGQLGGLGFNLLDGGLRALFFLAYLFGISRLREIHRVFMYHGAEHKVVFTYERRLPLTVENARAQSRLHPRCGTSFLLFVLLVSILVFALIPKSAPFLVKFGGRLVLVPAIAGLSYELLRLTARRRAAPLFAVLVFPGLMLQKITTQEPTDDMLAVAIAALEEALREDGRLTGPAVRALAPAGPREAVLEEEPAAILATGSYAP